MVTKELKDYIKLCRARKVPDKSIETILKEQGWSQKDINKAMTRFLIFKTLPSWISILTIAILVIAIGLTAWGAIFMLKDISETSSEITELSKNANKKEEPTSEIPPISQQELSQGWYWGNQDQKKSDTPDDWIYEEAGRSSCWHKPGTSCGQNGFCGWSTNGQCSSDSDCITGGCSNQVCQSTSEESAITTCEYRDCYDDEAYGVECKCVDNKCQW